MDNRINIAVYGAGALGTILGAFLTKAGLKVDLVTRNREQVKGLIDKGAQVTGTMEFTVPVTALLPEQMSKKYDVVFLLTKQTENDSVVTYISEFLSDSGVLCTLQNGLPEYGISRILGENRTFGCTVAWGATLIGGGVSKLTSDPEHLTFSLGSFGNGSSEKQELIKGILEKMGPVETIDNFIGARWSKLLINSAFSGLSAILGCTFGEVARNRYSRLCAQRIIKECIDVARNAGIKIEPVQGKDIVKLFDYNTKVKEKISNLIIPLAIRKHRDLKASLLQDLERGKKTEIEYINGIVRDFGVRHNTRTPYNNLVVDLVHRIESGELRPSFDNINLCKDPTMNSCQLRGFHRVSGK